MNKLTLYKYIDLFHDPLYKRIILAPGMPERNLWIKDPKLEFYLGYLWPRVLWPTKKAQSNILIKYTKLSFTFLNDFFFLGTPVSKMEMKLI